MTKETLLQHFHWGTRYQGPLSREGQSFQVHQLAERVPDVSHPGFLEGILGI